MQKLSILLCLAILFKVTYLNVPGGTPGHSEH
jgi:hypothetical protein